MGEIEAALMEHPDVGWSAIRCWPDAVGENALYAYVVARGKRSLVVSDLRGFLADRLPRYMIPQQFICVDALPRTPNGKIDRNALPRPVQLAPSWENGGPSPELTLEERKLAAIWCELLNVDDIGRDDDFFDLGGYSLLTVRLARRIADEFNRHVSIGDLLSAPTLSRMASMIEHWATRPQTNLIELQPLGDRPPLIWLDAGPLLRNVVQAMAPVQPVVGLSLRPDQEQQLIDAGFDVPMLASRIVTMIVAAFPAEPLHLGGWCRWGIVAFEVARQLEALGREVACLVLLDAQNPAARRQNFREQMRATLRVPGKRHIGSRALSFSQSVEEASRTYSPGPYSGAVALIRPR
ncbi:MAG: hypothetical protein JF564_08060, partial [Sphingomonas sp.]|nr:hypothetical protein [Sphingomonas sp.]